MDKETFLLEGLKNMQELIRFMDQKAGAAFVICGLALTVFVEISKGLRFTVSSTIAGTVTMIAGAIFIIILVWELHALMVRIIRPRLAQHYPTGDYSVFYFEHIAAMSRAEYLKAVNQPDIGSELANQSYELATALTSKVKRLSVAIKGLYAMVVALLIFILSSLSL